MVEEKQNIPHLQFSDLRPGKNSTRPWGYWYNDQGRGGGSTRLFGQSFSENGKEGRRCTKSTGNRVPLGTKCHHCGKSGHWKTEYYQRKAEEEAGRGTSRNGHFTFLAEDPQWITGSNWIIDSGASQHLSQNQNEFLTYIPVSQSQFITIADGTKLEVNRIGDVEIPTEMSVVQLTEVWHVPNIATSLISVTRMVNSGYSVEYGQTVCFVNNSSLETKLGNQKGSLYQLSLVSSPKTIESNSANETNFVLAMNQSPALPLTYGIEDYAIELLIQVRCDTYPGKYRI